MLSPILLFILCLVVRFVRLWFARVRKWKLFQIRPCCVFNPMELRVIRNLSHWWLRLESEMSQQNQNGSGGQGRWSLVSHSWLWSLLYIVLDDLTDNSLSTARSSLCNKGMRHVWWNMYTSTYPCQTIEHVLNEACLWSRWCLLEKHGFGKKEHRPLSRRGGCPLTD